MVRSTFVVLVAVFSSCTVVAQEDRSAFELGAAYFPFRTFGAAGWEPVYSVHASYLTPLNSRLVVAWTVDYYGHRFESNDPMFNTLTADGTRSDIAVYPALRVGNLFEFAGGIYYSRQGAVYNHAFGGPTDVFRKAESGIHLYYHLGLVRSFAVADRWNTSFGVLYRKQDYGGVVPLAIRAGVSYML